MMACRQIIKPFARWADVSQTWCVYCADKFAHGSTLRSAYEMWRHMRYGH